MIAGGKTFLELLVTLIEKFEAEHYPIPAGTTGSMLGHLMEARDLEEADTNLNGVGGR